MNVHQTFFEPVTLAQKGIGAGGARVYLTTQQSRVDSAPPYAAMNFGSLRPRR